MAPSVAWRILAPPPQPHSSQSITDGAAWSASHATDALRGSVLGTATFGDTATALLAAGALWAAVSVITRRSAAT